MLDLGVWHVTACGDDVVVRDSVVYQMNMWRVPCVVAPADFWWGGFLGVGTLSRGEACWVLVRALVERLIGYW